MLAYYNEHDPFAAQWLRNLIDAGQIMPGRVDERDIRDVRPADLYGFVRCHFFAGIGGWDLALQLASWPVDRPVWTGSCPCQPFSAAGRKAGLADERHLWPDWFRLIRQCEPDVLFGEQVEAAVRLGWLDAVFADLEGQGYACGAAVLGAHSVGAPHIRQRLWFVADTAGAGRRHAEDAEDAGADRGHPGALQSGGQGQSGFCEPQRGGDTSPARFLADADRERFDRQPARLRWTDETGRHATDHAEAAGCGEAITMADGPGPRLEGRDARTLGLECQAAQRGGTAGGMGDADSRREATIGGVSGWSDALGEGGPWAATEWLPCRDGKSRPTQPGLQPLAHGIPNRVGLLRGAGNAIVPQAAAAFIAAADGAVLEAECVRLGGVFT